MGRKRRSADEAFDVLPKASQQRNTKLRHVATAIARAGTATGDPHLIGGS